MTPTGRRRDLRLAVARHRRLLASGLLAGSVALGLQAVTPDPPAGTPVLVAARDLPGGAPLRAGDLQVRAFPADLVPAGAAARPHAVLGPTLTGPVGAGEVLTAHRLLGPALLGRLDAGQVATPVRLADPQAAALLRPGDVVDVLAAGDGTPARLLAASVRVLARPEPADRGIGAAAGDGALVVLSTTSGSAARLAGAAVTDQLSVTLRAPG